MRVSGMTPAQTLKMPLPKQLQKNRMLRTTKPILHSIAIMITPEMPMQAGITYLRIIAFCQRSSCSKPYMQQNTEKARKDPPTTRLRILRMQVTSERCSLSLRILDLVFLLSTRSSIALAPISESFCRRPSLESFLLSMKICLVIINPSNKLHINSPPTIPWHQILKQVTYGCCGVRTIFIINLMMRNDRKMEVFVFQEQGEGKQEEIVEESLQEGREQKMEKDIVNESPVQIDCFQGDFYPIQSPSFQATTQRDPPAAITVNPVLQTQDEESKPSNFLFLQQNAYSFRKNDLQAPKQTAKKVQNELQIISDFHSQTSNNEGLLQEEQQQISMKSQKEESISRVSSRRSMKRMNEDSSAKSYKTKEKLQDQFASRKLVPNMMKSLQESNRTEDNINEHSNPQSTLLAVDSSLNQAVKRRRQKQGPLLPIEPEKSGQVFINTSGIIQNETSFNSLSKKDPFKLASLSSLTHMANSQQEQQSFTEKVVPEHRVVKCTFKRQKQCFSNYYYPQYSFLFKNGKFIANARKQFAHINSHYNITASPQQYSEDSQHFLGFLKGNFFGSEFNLYQYINNVNVLVCTICYQSQFSCSPTFRKMEIYIKDQKCAFSSLVGSDQAANLKDLYELGKNAEQKKIVKLINKKPEWSEKLDSYFLDLKGHCKYASVKNMVLISEQTPKKYNLLCCKTDSNQFHTEISHPLSPFIAMGIILSSFDFKLCCQ